MEVSSLPPALKRRFWTSSMIDIFVHLLLGVNKILFNNLGLTIIFIGALSRVIFYPFMAHSMRYSQVMRDLKPRLDEAKKKYKGDVRKMSEEQNRIFREVGVNPAAKLIPQKIIKKGMK